MSVIVLTTDIFLFDRRKCLGRNALFSCELYFIQHDTEVSMTGLERTDSASAPRRLVFGVPITDSDGEIDGVTKFLWGSLRESCSTKFHNRRENLFIGAARNTSRVLFALHP
jgi:hypothetical protein